MIMHMQSHYSLSLLQGVTNHYKINKVVIEFRFWQAGVGVAISLIVMNLAVTGAVAKHYNISPLLLQ